MGELEALKAGVRPLTMVHIDSLNQEAQLLKRLIDDLYQLSTVNCQHLILVPCVMNLQK